MEFYKGTVERCRDVFKRHPKPEGGWLGNKKVEKEERSGEGAGTVAGGEGRMGRRASRGKARIN